MSEALIEDTITIALRASKGDEEALKRLKKTDPKAFGILQKEWFHLAKRTEDALAKAVSNDLLVGESIKHQAQELRETLCAVHRTPLEKLLVDRVVCCWIAVSHADLVAATLKPRDRELQRWVDRCYRRFSSACKDLATVSKLLGPNVQINLAKYQQVANVFTKNDG